MLIFIFIFIFIFILICVFIFFIYIDLFSFIYIYIRIYLFLKTKYPSQRWRRSLPVSKSAEMIPRAANLGKRSLILKSLPVLRDLRFRVWG